MIRYGKVTRFVLRHFLRDGLPLDRELSLSTDELKAMRQMRRQRQKQGLAQMYAASKKLGLYDGELDGIPRLTHAQHAALVKAEPAQHGAVLDSVLDVVPPRPVPVLTTAQEAWLRGIDCEAFSLEKAVEMYANRERK